MAASTGQPAALAEGEQVAASPPEAASVAANAPNEDVAGIEAANPGEQVAGVQVQGLGGIAGLLPATGEPLVPLSLGMLGLAGLGVAIRMGRRRPR